MVCTPEGSFAPTAARGVVGSEFEWELQIPVPADRSFWRDTEVTGQVRLVPAFTSAVVQGATYPVVIRMEAPFKRLAFYAAGLLALFGVVWGGLTVYGRLTTTPGPRAVDTRPRVWS